MLSEGMLLFETTVCPCIAFLSFPQALMHGGLLVLQALRVCCDLQWMIQELEDLLCVSTLVAAGCC